MAKEKNEEYKDIKLDEVLKKLQEKKLEILERFAEAYLAETGLKPSEVEMVTQQMPMNDQKIIEHVYFFRRKT